MLPRYLIVVVCSLSSVILSAGSACGQAGTAGFPFLNIHVAPQTHALGSATAALEGYAGAGSINPATIGQKGHVQLSSPLSLGTSGIPLLSSAWDLPVFERPVWIAAPSIAARWDRWAAEYEYKRFNLEPSLEAGETSYDMAHTLTAAYEVTPSWRVGVGVRWLRSRIVRQGRLSPSDGTARRSELTATTFSVNLGMYYTRTLRTSYGTVRGAAGWSLTDLGPTYAYESRTTDRRPSETPLPMTIRGGLALHLATAGRWHERPVFRIGLYGALSKVLAGRDSLEGEPYGPFEALVKTWGPVERPSSEGHRLTTWEQIVRHRGRELSVLDVLSVWRGRFYEDEENGARQFSTVGWELDLYYVALAHSWVGEARENAQLRDLSFWQITGRVPLSPSERNFWPDVLRWIGFR